LNQIVGKDVIAGQMASKAPQSGNLSFNEPQSFVACPMPPAASRPGGLFCDIEFCRNGARQAPR
jgi:hypothetical protein